MDLLPFMTKQVVKFSGFIVMKSSLTHLSRVIMLRHVQIGVYIVNRTRHDIIHKLHIGKVHCTIGYYFDSDVERGGEGILNGLQRCAKF